VEADIFYAAIFENKETTPLYNPAFFDAESNIIEQIDPDITDEQIKKMVKVYDVSKKRIKIISDIETGETLCFAQTSLPQGSL
jgi:hypothetical protein